MGCVFDIVGTIKIWLSNTIQVSLVPEKLLLISGHYHSQVHLVQLKSM